MRYRIYTPRQLAAHPVCRIFAEVDVLHPFLPSEGKRRVFDEKEVEDETDKRLLWGRKQNGIYYVPHKTEGGRVGRGVVCTKE